MHHHSHSRVELVRLKIVAALTADDGIILGLGALPFGKCRGASACRLLRAAAAVGTTAHAVAEHG